LNKYQSQEHIDNNSYEQNYSKIQIIGYLFSIISFILFLIYYIESNIYIKAQAINWFYVSILSAMIPTLIPHLSEFNFGGLGIKLYETQKKIDKTQNEIQQIQNEIADEQKKGRIQIYNNFANAIDKISEPAQYEILIELNRFYQNQLQYDVSTVKTNLKKIHCYKGNLDNHINKAYIDSIKAFQKKYYPDLVDGIIGELTIREIDKLANPNGKGKIFTEYEYS